MNAEELKRWRERTGLTQADIAGRLQVTRATIQNWESGTTLVPAYIEAACGRLEVQLKQNDPEFGPVMLTYANGPMYGPHQKLAMMQQEHYPSNLAALLRVFEIWEREDVYNPFIMEASGEMLWNSVELAKVVEGRYENAPIGIKELMKIIAEDDRYILYEKGFPHNDQLKKDFISVKSADGRNVQIFSKGYRSAYLVMPREIFEHLRRLGFIDQIGGEEEPHCIKFKITAAGLASISSGEAA
jgi:transcriptional regulator with XRE-family HTH domain